jgi:hypothetical protein
MPKKDKEDKPVPPVKKPVLPQHTDAPVPADDPRPEIPPGPPE